MNQAIGGFMVHLAIKLYAMMRKLGGILVYINMGWLHFLRANFFSIYNFVRMDNDVFEM